MIDEPTVKKAVEFAIATEELGAKFYNRLARRYEKNAELHDALTTLAKDEERHKARFTALLAKVPDEGPDLDFERKQYLKALSLTEIFAHERSPRKDEGETETQAEVMGRAMHLEKTSLLFYKALQELVADEEGILDEIIAEERKHLVAVMKYAITGAKMRGLDD